MAVADKPTPRPPEDEPSLIPSYMRHEASGPLPERQTFEEMRTIGRRRLPLGRRVALALGFIFMVGVLAAGGWSLWNREQPQVTSTDTVEALPTPVVIRAATGTPASAPAAAPISSVPPPPGRQARDVSTSTPGPPLTVMPAGVITPTAVATRPVETQTARSAPPVAQPGAQTRPNGPLIRAVAVRPGGTGIDDLRQRLTQAGAEAVAIASPVYGGSNWDGPQDLSGQLWAGWDTANLYLLVDVTDDVFVQESAGILLYQGDSIEVQLDADLAGDFTSRVYNDDDWQIGLSPGNLLSASPQWQWWSYRGSPGAGNIQMSAARNSSGYSLSAAIPWSLLKVTPREGGLFGFAVNVNDNDTPGTLEQKAMVSTSPVRQLNDPTSWGTLQLVGPRS